MSDVAPARHEAVVPDTGRRVAWFLLGILVVLVLGWVTHYLNDSVPDWAEDTWPTTSPRPSNTPSTPSFSDCSGTPC